MLADTLGYAGGVLLGICLLPEVVHIWRSKRCALAVWGQHISFLITKITKNKHSGSDRGCREKRSTGPLWEGLWEPQAHVACSMRAGDVHVVVR